MRGDSEAASKRATKVQEVILSAMAKRIRWWQAAEILGMTERNSDAKTRGALQGYIGMIISDQGNSHPEAIVKTLLCLLGVGVLAFAAGFPQSPLVTGRALFESNCAICHGEDARGGERAPSLLHAQRTKKEIRRIISNGKAGGAMPAFHFLPKQELALVSFVYSLSAPAAGSGITGDAAAGKAYFWGKGRCGSCHMIYGRGGVNGPDLTLLGHERKLQQIEKDLSHPTITHGYQVVEVQLRDGRSLTGFARNETDYNLQLQDWQGDFHFLQRSDIVRIVREKQPLMPPVRLSRTDLDNLLAYLISPTPPEGVPETTLGSVTPGAGDWATYNGQMGGSRYNPLDQINVKNVGQLAPRWIFTIPRSGELETTPVVEDGLMIVTSPNEAYALDARNGREIWHFHHTDAQGKGEEIVVPNRGVAIRGNEIFMATPDAHMLALNRVTGGLVWDVKVADYHQGYRITGAPLVVRNLVITGIGCWTTRCARGFIGAYNASTGKRVWRFWTTPAPGSPLARTWIGRALPHGGVPTWMSGTYDPVNDLLYWTTGNPNPVSNGDERKGDNLYSDSVVALKPATGKLQWYFQFTPYDVHDWDAEETPLLVNAKFHGRKRHLLLQANRNGFFYVLDRITGRFLMAKPFVHKLTWARGIAPDGRPEMLPGSVPTADGAKVCPAAEGATNWMSPAWNPATGLFYVQALEKCEIYFKGSSLWQPGKPFFNGITRGVPGEPGKRYLRAIDIQTGRVVWEDPQVGPGNTWGGVLATGGGLVFFCDDDGSFAAADARTGKVCWHFPTNQSWHASPMTYMAGDKQYVAVAAGTSIVAFGL